LDAEAIFKVSKVYNEWERVLAVVIVEVFRSLIKYIRKLPARQRLVLIKASINKTIFPMNNKNQFY